MSEMGMLELEKIARAGYRAYVKSCGGKSVHGEILPTWEEQRMCICISPFVGGLGTGLFPRRPVSSNQPPKSLPKSLSLIVTLFR